MRKLDSLQAWQTARKLSRSAYRLTLTPPLSQHFGLSDQVRRAAASIPANIAEGYALGTTAQFVKFLRIALASATELATHLELVEEFQLAAQDPTRDAVVLANQEVGLLIGLVYSLQRRTRPTRPTSPVPRPTRASPSSS